MKILCLAPYIFDEDFPEFRWNKTGFGIMVRTICTQLGKRHEVALLSNVITSGHSGKETCAAFEILPHRWKDVLFCVRLQDIVMALRLFVQDSQSLRMRFHYAYYGLNQGAVRAAIRKFAPDVVHIHGGEQTAYLAMESCRKMQVPFVMTLHGILGNRDGVISKRDKRCEKVVLQMAEQERIPVSIVGSGGKRKLCELYGLTGENIISIPNCVDMEEEPVAVDVRKVWNIPAENHIIAVVGNITVNKNQVQVAQAYALLPESLRQTTTVLFLGTESDGGALAQEIQRQKAEDHLILCGFVPHNELENYYRAASLTVLASITEGFGLSIAEGFQFGVPAVFFEDMDAASDLYAEDAAILVKERTTRALADAIQTALKRTWDVSVIQKHGAQFAPQRIAEKYLALLGCAANSNRKERL